MVRCEEHGEEEEEGGGVREHLYTRQPKSASSCEIKEKNASFFSKKRFFFFFCFSLEVEEEGKEDETKAVAVVADAVHRSVLRCCPPLC